VVSEALRTMEEKAQAKATAAGESGAAQVTKWDVSAPVVGGINPALATQDGKCSV
jgi:hypothetical protein